MTDNLIDLVKQYRIARKPTWEVIVTIKRSQDQLVQVYHNPYAYLILNILIIQSACNFITTAALLIDSLWTQEPLFLTDFSRSLSLCML